MEEDFIHDTKMLDRARRENSELNPAPHRHGGLFERGHALPLQRDNVDWCENSENSGLNPAPHRHGGAPQLASRAKKKADIELAATPPS